MKQLITETCPNCEKEITIAWDVKKDGYKTICPNCGKTLMLAVLVLILTHIVCLAIGIKKMAVTVAEKSLNRSLL